MSNLWYVRCEMCSFRKLFSSPVKWGVHRQTGIQTDRCHVSSSPVLEVSFPLVHVHVLALAQDPIHAVASPMCLCPPSGPAALFKPKLHVYITLVWVLVVRTHTSVPQICVRGPLSTPRVRATPTGRTSRRNERVCGVFNNRESHLHDHNMS